MNKSEISLINAFMRFLALILMTAFFGTGNISWAASVEVIPNRGAAISDAEVVNLVQQKLPASELASAYRIRAQVVSLHKGVVDSLLVYLNVGKDIKTEIISVDKAAAVRKQLSEVSVDHSARTALAETTTVFCPDESVRFLSVSQRHLSWDQKSSKEVAQMAEQNGLKTVVLLESAATRQNYLNYLSCPRLVGDFYDGDANPNEIEAIDGPITAEDASIVLKNSFQKNVLHVWVACKAFNDPMLSAMVNDAQSQKFISGKVDLIAGYADRTGVCVMESALAGKSISESLTDCHQEKDLHWHNQWGIGGNGSDFLSR